MIQQLLYAFCLASVTVILHAAATVYIVVPAAGLWSRKRQPTDLPRPMAVLTR